MAPLSNSWWQLASNWAGGRAIATAVHIGREKDFSIKNNSDILCAGGNETTDRERGDDDGSPVSSWRRKLCRHKTWFPLFFEKKKSWGFISSNNINNNTTQTEDEGYPSAALFCFCCRVVGCSFLFFHIFLFSFFFLFQPATTPTLYTMISHFRLSETGWDISFFLSFFLWERGFRRDINVYKVIKFKLGEERKRKKTGISTDRRRRTYIWVRDDQQLYRKHFSKNGQQHIKIQYTAPKV